MVTPLPLWGAFFAQFATAYAQAYGQIVAMFEGGSFQIRYNL